MDKISHFIEWMNIKLSLSIEINKKEKTSEQIQITKSSDVFQLKEVQEIKSYHLKK